MAAVTSPARHAASLATSGSNRERRQSKVHRAMEWPKPSSVRSNVTMSASVRARMHRPSCTSSQLGLITTTRFTPTRLSDIVHPVSSSQLTEARDRCPVVRGLQQALGVCLVLLLVLVGGGVGWFYYTKLEEDRRAELSRRLIRPDEIVFTDTTLGQSYGSWK